VKVDFVRVKPGSRIVKTAVWSK